MSRSVAVLPLHYGKAPRWLFSRMVKLADCIVEIVIDEYGSLGLLQRLSDPWFFQSLSCVLGYDWHSSGTTTVTCGALKEAIKPEEHGVAVAGGKGKASNRAPQQIEETAQRLGISSQRAEELVYASRMAAKVDNALVQDGYPLYHHSFFFDEQGNWIVVQQGINTESRQARRYHWPPEHGSFVEEPQNAILCDEKRPVTLDMTARQSEECRRTSVDLAKEKPEKLRRLFNVLRSGPQRSLDQWTDEDVPKLETRETLYMPRNINWDRMRQVYEFQPRNYEEFVSLRGVGPATIRGLALVSELVYGSRPSWEDPVRFSFAFGGKDGVPFPVDRRAMDEAVEVLRNGIGESKLKQEEKLRAVERLRRCVPPVRRTTL
jgi:hypothetical protein